MAGMVIVVDDDLAVREALRSLVRSTGLECETFKSAADFLRQPLPEPPACLILDVQLADASGLELALELRRAGVDMPIVFITGYGTIPLSVRAMKAGAVEFLTKPFSEAELLGAVEQALHRDHRPRVAHAKDAARADRAAAIGTREARTPVEPVKRADHLPPPSE